MNTLASRNPDQKIKAIAALENSQKRSHQLEANFKSRYNEKTQTIDLKFCSVYAQSGKQNYKFVNSKIITNCKQKIKRFFPNLN